MDDKIQQSKKGESHENTRNQVNSAISGTTRG